MAFTPNESFLGGLCEHCNYGKYEETLDYNEWWVRCPECNAYKFCYVPMPHQERFHTDPNKFRMYAGGFGSAKTSTCAAEMIMAGLSTPNGAGLIGAQTYPQLESTAMKEFKLMLTKDLIEVEHVQKKEIILVNGYTYMFRSFDTEGKLRSLNLTHWWVEEASEVDFDIFSQLKTRLRNNATDKHFGIMSTNPDINWIRTDFLLVSRNIYGAEVRYHQDENEIDDSYSTHIATTKSNTYLPDDYYETNAKNKPVWWIKRYLHGSFEHTEGKHIYFALFKHDKIGESLTA